MGRPSDKHLDSVELAVLAPWPSESGQDLHRLPAETVRETELHVESCGDCGRKVAKYRELVAVSSNVAMARATPQGQDCPQGHDVDWVEVAAGRWPELKAAELITHAALCDQCGPLLRAATPVDDDPTLQEEKLLAELKPPSRPVTTVKARPIPARPGASSLGRRLLQWNWYVPAAAMILLIALLSTSRWSSPKPLSGQEYARFAVKTNEQLAQGDLALDIHADSEQTLNEWFKAKTKLSLTLPASPLVPGEKRPFRLEGARLLRVGGEAAVFIAYRMQSGPVGLMVTPTSVAVASGGVQVSYKRVSFHYDMVGGYKVVTWSLHGLTYALVSQEGNSTQQSCMVCHSAMRDRDLSQTPTPLETAENFADPVWQSFIHRRRSH